MEDDPFFNTETYEKKDEDTPPIEEKKEETPKEPDPPKKLPEIKVEVPEEKEAEEKVKNYYSRNTPPD